ncbi:unnamed protein product [Darwinula stevensoni]|uniref:Serine/threonine-protein kinase RIO3 n=1 Tax=Darwinula stevensoni TaxID=69355 RepID=A0A7R9A287_9CRUS|nr:unnamed protein product [Darwinula stevensoni]CAG0888226.1 unnamed protein product [Darwinula stevensoni]
MDGGPVELIHSSKEARCAWNISQPQTVTASLADVMSEELAKALQEEEDSSHKQWQSASPLGASGVDSNDKPGDCSEDYLLALLLQEEFDREQNFILKKEEDKFNGNSKVAISFSNYRRVVHSESDSEDEFADEDDLHRTWDSFEKSQKESPAIGKCGYSKSVAGITTKHDTKASNRRNACRIMEFPPGFATGDGGGFDMQLSNNVFNKLKLHSMSEEKRTARVHDKMEKSTAMMALDPKTRLLIYKWVNSGMLDSVDGTISTGKESVVIHAQGGECKLNLECHCRVEDMNMPKECAIKAFKTTLNEFKTRHKYIREDYRFKDRNTKLNTRKIIHVWAQKEMHNLERLERAGIPAPRPLVLKKHLLLMEFIGKDSMAAPKLKDLNLKTQEWELAYGQVEQDMKRMYEDAGLVHADLSEYNILYHNGKCYFIDVSQAVTKNVEQALHFLYRDCGNISNITKYEKNKEMLTFGVQGKPYAFDFFWEKSMDEKVGEPEEV